MKPSLNRTCFVVVLALVATLLIASSAAEAAFQGANGKIAFVRGDDIYVMNPDGSGQKRLAKGSYPAWSPDGRRIAFASVPIRDAEVFVMNSDGSRRRQLTNRPGTNAQPAWSPDGRKIAFASGRVGGSADVYFMNADGTRVRQLTNGSPPAENPAWSPDGRKIAFQSLPFREIFTINASGGGQSQLTNNLPHIFDIEPAWSPDGRKIAFTSNRGDTPLTGGGENHEVYTMNADGSEQTQITNDPATDLGVAWSPDGRKIAFERFRTAGGLPSGDPEIHVMGADGTGLTKVAVGAAPDWQPAPSCRVPRVVQKALKAAKRAIRAAGCSVGKVKRRRSARVRRGRVISQAPRAGKRLPSGASVNLTVSGG